MSNGKNLRHVGDRIDGLLQEFGAVADPRIRGKAEELVRLLMELYGGALARILEMADEAVQNGETLVDRLAADDLVASLLILHGLHPLDVEARIVGALDRVRPYLGSHGGDVKLLGVTDGVVHLRLVGSCHGCPSSAVTMKLAIEKAIEEAAPEVIRIEVEGAEQPVPAASFGNGGAPKNSAMPAHALHALSGEWIKVDKLPDLSTGDMVVTELGGKSVLVCRVGETLYAYQDSCPSCGTAMRGSALQGSILTCSSCSRPYDVCHAGQCIDKTDLQMAPLPLLVEQDGMKIAIATEG